MRLWPQEIQASAVRQAGAAALQWYEYELKKDRPPPPSDPTPKAGSNDSTTDRNPEENGSACSEENDGVGNNSKDGKNGEVSKSEGNVEGSSEGTKGSARKEKKSLGGCGFPCPHCARGFKSHAAMSGHKRYCKA